MKRAEDKIKREKKRLAVGRRVCVGVSYSLFARARVRVQRKEKAVEELLLRRQHDGAAERLAWQARWRCVHAYPRAW